MGGITTEYDIDIKTDKEKQHVKEFVINLFMTSIWYYNLCGYVVKVKNRNVAEAICFEIDQKLFRMYRNHLLAIM